MTEYDLWKCSEPEEVEVPGIYKITESYTVYRSYYIPANNSDDAYDFLLRNNLDPDEVDENFLTIDIEFCEPNS